MNWRSPPPPVGKRVKIQLDSSDSEDESDDDVYIQGRLDVQISAGRVQTASAGQVSDENEQDDDDADDADIDDDDDDDNTDHDVNFSESEDDSPYAVVHEKDEDAEDEVDDEDEDGDVQRYRHAGGSRMRTLLYYFEDSDDSNDSDDGSDNDDSPVSTDFDSIIPDDDEDGEGRGQNIEYDSDDEDDLDTLDPGEYLKHDPTPETQYPKPDWITVNELRQRRCGFPSTKLLARTANMYWFERYVNNSLWMIQRLELSRRLKGHTGCVNSLDFNKDGNLLCSGSDDLIISIWDWQQDKSRKRINTGHTNNVFHSQFDHSNDNIITASRDGTVRLINIETSISELLMTQSGEIGKLAFITPHTLVTCGTNASVNLIDLRIRDPSKAQKLFLVRNPRNNRSCALHTITAHPMDKHKIVVAGESPYVFLYDLRRARDPNDKEHKPYHVLDTFENSRNIVTSTAFNSNGDKLLISYSDDDLYVCITETCEVIHRYTGHRNKKTLKGCAWFGDNFVLSGSDDGHIYGWDVKSEHIVCFLEGDINGVVNTLCVHPRIPVLASSGLDHDVKIWQPTSSIWPQTLKGIKPQICKNTIRRERAKNRRILNQRYLYPEQESNTDFESDNEDL